MPVQDRRSRIAASVLALLTAISIWLSAGLVFEGASGRIAALPSFQVLALLVVVLVAMAWFAKLRLEHAWPLAISLILWLPFIGASAIWDGPIEGIVWLLVAAGLIAARPPRLPIAFLHPRVAPWMAALFIALASAIVFGQVRNVIPGGDEPHYLAATQSLIHDGDLKVANNYEQGDYLEYFPGRLEPHFLKRSTGGEIYSIHAPGVSVIVLPAFLAAGYTGAVWTMILVAALSAALMWRAAFAVSGSVAAAWAGVTGVSLSAPYFFHTFTIYPEIIGGLCVLSGAWVLIEFAAGRDPATRTLVAAGAALAVLPWLHTRFAVLAGIVGLLIAARLSVRPSAVSRIGAFLSVPFLLGAAWFGFFYVVWGSPNPAVAYGADTSTSWAYVSRGAIGLLFDQQFGVLTTAPIYVIAIAGAFILFKMPRLAFELALIVIPYALTVASYAMWWGGAAAPGRFLVSVLPLAVLPLAVAWTRSVTLRVAALVLIVVSSALVVPRAFEDNGRFIFNNRSGVDATVLWLSANFNLPAAVPSVHGGGGTVALRAGVIWLAGFTAAVFAAGWLSRGRSIGWRFTVTAALMAILVLTASGAVVTSNVELRADRHLAVLERLRPWHSTIVQLTPWSPSSQDVLLERLSTTIVGPAAVLNRVPAGEYEIAGGPGASAGSMRIALGRNDLPIAQPSLDDLRNPQAPYRLKLPVMARNLRIDIDVREQAEYTLRPVGTVLATVRQPATRAARIGNATAFFFDDWAYPERDGFWTRAEGEATVVIDGNDPARSAAGLPIVVTAGQAATTIRIAIESWEEAFALDPGQTRAVTLPASPSGTWTVRFHSGAGFRPSEREPGNRDVRNLAAWIVIP